MKPYYEKGKVKLYKGDCLDVLKQLEPNSIDSIITDPPYSLSSIKKRFSKTSLNDDNKTSKNAKEGNTPHARLSKGFMGKDWDNEIAFNPEVWEQCLRVAKPGCILMALGGSRTWHRLTCAIEDAGWEIRDCISYFNDASQQEMAFLNSLNDEQLGAYLELHYPGLTMVWVYGSGMPLGYDISKGIDKAKGKERKKKRVEYKGNELYRMDGQNTRPWMEEAREKGYHELEDNESITDLAKQFDGYNTRLKPAVEFIVVAQKSIEKNYAYNAEKWGVAGYNIEESKVEVNRDNERQYDKESLSGITGAKDKSTFVSSETNPRQDNWLEKGRYPSNLIHDNSDEVNKEFDKVGVSKSGQNTKGEKSTIKNVYGGFKIEKSLVSHSDSGTPARFFQFCPPDTELERPARFLYTPKVHKKESRKGNSHPTKKPLALMKYLCRLTKTPTGGIVLDLFAGSGTTLLAAKEEGREAIGIELEEEYCQIIKKRLQGRSDVTPDKDIDETEKKTGVLAEIDSIMYD